MEAIRQDLNKKSPIRGLMIMGAGLTLLLYTLGLVEKGITTFLVFFALLLIAYGFVKSGFYGTVKRAVKGYKKQPKKKVVKKAARKKVTKKPVKKTAKKVTRKK